MKRNLFKRIEEANNVKAADIIEIIPSSKSYLLELLEMLCTDPEQAKLKSIKLTHPALKIIKENFAKPSPDHLIHINRND